MEELINIPPIHPGEVLLEDFMKPAGLTYCRLAGDLGILPIRVSQIARGKRAITADTAMGLARYFGTSAEIWLRLQARYDLEVAQEKVGARLGAALIAPPGLRGSRVGGRDVAGSCKKARKENIKRKGQGENLNP